MRILIFGGTGMLGHRLWFHLSKSHETWVTVRGDRSQIPDEKGFPKEFVLPNIDSLEERGIQEAIDQVQPEWVINCIGLVKQLPLAQEPLPSIAVNALLPHRMARICGQGRIRLIHFSTDCVFSGRKGAYVETDPSDAEDLYGRTKYLGEVNYPHALTLRTSMIGRELKTRHGLIEWFLAQKGAVQGYTRAIYTGFTTDEMARIVLNQVIPHPDLSGVYHVSSDPISKYDLLGLVKRVFRKKITILPDDRFVSDRSLDSTRFRQKTGYQPPSWEAMIDEMERTSTFYDRFRGDSHAQG